MTENYRKKTHNLGRDAAKRHLRMLLPLVLIPFLLVLSGTAADGVRAGLSLCVQSVIPALFPFLVLSPMLVCSIQVMLGRLCGGRLNERRSALLSAFVIGMTAGFPIGAVTLVSLCKQGVIAKADAERFLGVCTGASPAFLIGYFGRALWGSARLGFGLWCMQVLICLGGFLYLEQRLSAEQKCTASTDIQMPHLSDCLRDAVFRMMGICGAVVFFTVIRAYLCGWLPIGAAVMLGGIAEMTGGLRECAVLCETGVIGRTAALVISAAMIGFGGICVGMQTADAALSEGISMRRYRVQRLFLGLVMGALTFVFCSICEW